MNQLSPFEKFVVYRQLHDHTDSTTYYVSAIIKDAKKGTVIDTLKLTDQGDGYFSHEWKVSRDSSGQGTYITIQTIVYSDTNYSIKATDYGVEGDTYLIQDRIENFVPGPQGIAMSELTSMLDKRFPKSKVAKAIDYTKDIANLRKELGSLKVENKKLQVSLKDIIKSIKGIVIPVSKEVIIPDVITPLNLNIKASEAILSDLISDTRNEIIKIVEDRNISLISSISKTNSSINLLDTNTTKIKKQLLEAYKNNVYVVPLMERKPEKKKINIFK